jgi:3-phenylpropionate/trans-cinnamate dioxygenase ferredoxin reductase subunit
LESVQNALDQGRTVGSTAVGKAVPYAAVPRFWSDQCDSRLQIAGLSMDHDSRVVRGSPADGRFSVFLYRGADLIGIESVNSPADHVAGRKMLAAGVSIRPAQALDPAFDLKALVSPA